MTNLKFAAGVIIYHLSFTIQIAPSAYFNSAHCPDSQCFATERYEESEICRRRNNLAFSIYHSSFTIQITPSANFNSAHCPDSQCFAAERYEESEICRRRNNLAFATNHLSFIIYHSNCAFGKFQLRSMR
jgi:hypothetical protein